MEINIYKIGKELFITSDEEIKEGDKWIYNIHWNEPQKRGENWLLKILNESSNTFKIILSTDQDLINDGVQSIDDEFLEWFVKNPSCEEVETIIVSTWCNDGKVCVCNVPKFCNEKRNDFKYKIIIPKEEQKELRRKLFTLIKSLEQEEPKEETLEEAAEKWLNKDGFNEFNHYDTRPSFIQGAKYQAERMYSEKDMEEYFIAYWKANVPEGIECKLSFNEWFNDIKKK